MEVRRLETALERLLINLGSDRKPPQREEIKIPQTKEEKVEEEEEPEPKPIKRHAEDNKLTNTFASVPPQNDDSLI